MRFRGVGLSVIIINLAVNCILNVDKVIVYYFLEKVRFKNRTVRNSYLQ